MPSAFHLTLLVLVSATCAAFSAWYLSRRPRSGPVVTAGLVFAPCALLFLPLFLSPALPSGDSWLFHFPAFGHVARSLAEHRLFPAWFPTSGGIRIGYFHVHAPALALHRLFGYLVYCLLPVSASLAYKLQYVFGIFLMGSGWFLCLKRSVGSPAGALLGTLMVVLGGTGITVHQEQVIFTTVLIPWFLLALLGLAENPAFLFPVAILFGLGLSTHYPAIQTISMVSAALACAACNPRRVRPLFAPARRWWWALFLLVSLGALPSLYLGLNLKRLSSGLRGAAASEAPSTYADYLALNRSGGACSAAPGYLRQYLVPRWEKDARSPLPWDLRDPCSFFVGRAGILLALAGLILGFRRAWPAALLAVLFASLSLGLNSPLPAARILYVLRFPTIAVFRQWLHFFPMLNFCLAYLAALGMAEILARVPRPGIWAAALAFVQAAELGWYDQNYLSRFLRADPPPAMASGFFSREDVVLSGAFQYRDRFRLARTCPEKAIPSSAFLTGQVAIADSAHPPSINAICRLLSVDSAPAAVVRGGEVFPAPEEADSPAVDSQLTPAGLEVEFSAPRRALLVTPMNYGLDAAGSIDGEEAEVLCVNGALCGMVVPAGEHRARFAVRRDLYDAILVSQWALYLLAAALLIRETRRASRSR